MPDVGLVAMVVGLAGSGWAVATARPGWAAVYGATTSWGFTAFTGYNLLRGLF